MIKGTFKLGSDLIDAIIRDKNLIFHDNSSGAITTIEGLRISRAGVLKEHPDLKDNPDWKKIAIDRLKKHIKSLEKEIKMLYYVKDELNKFGYEALHYQKAGFRPRKFK